MKILFIKNVSRQGTVGQVKEVPQGFAEFLIKAGNAVVATDNVIAQNSKKIEEATLKTKGEESYAHEVSKRIDGKTIQIKGGSNNKGSLYKALHKKDILEAISKEIVVTIPENIISDVSIKATGKHQVELNYKGKKLGNFEIDVV